MTAPLRQFHDALGVITRRLSHGDSRLRQAFILLAASSLVRALGTAASLAMTFHVGTGPEMDRYIAFSLVMATLGPLVAAPMPVLVSQEFARTGSIGIAAHVSRPWARRIGTISGSAYLVLIPLLAYAFTPPGAPGMTELALMLLIGLPAIAATPSATMEQSVLQAQGRVMSAIGCTAVATGLAFLGALLSGLIWGVEFSAVGVALGVTMEWRVLRRMNRPLDKSTNSAQHTRSALPWKSILIVAISSCAGLLLGFYDQALLAQMGQGTQAVWGSATRIPSFLGMCLAGVAGVLCSARLAQAKGEGNLSSETFKLFGIIFVMSLVLSSTAFIAAEPLTRLLFERGAFNAADTAAVSSILLWTLLAYLGYPAGAVLARSVGLLGANRTLIISAVAYACVKVFAIKMLIPSHGVAALGISTLLGCSAQLCVLSSRFFLDRPGHAFRGTIDPSQKSAINT